MMCHSKFRLMSKVVFVLTLAGLSGCIGDDLSNCFQGVPVRISLHEDVPEGTEAIKDITLYVFDEKDLLLDIFPANISETVILNYQGNPNLHCIALGNIQDGSVTVTPLSEKDPLEKGFVSLKTATRPATRAADIYPSPSDLFFGELNLDNNQASNRADEKEFSVSRMTASMNITVRGLQLLTGDTRGNYTVTVHETASRMNFKGQYSGNPASYEPQGNMNAKNEFVAPTFRLFPTLEGGLTIDIYHNGQLLRSVTTTSDNQPIIPVVGKTLNVLLDFERTTNIEITITPWGVTQIWKDFG